MWCKNVMPLTAIAILKGADGNVSGYRIFDAYDHSVNDVPVCKLDSYEQDNERKITNIRDHELCNGGARRYPSISYRKTMGRGRNPNYLTVVCIVGEDCLLADYRGRCCLYRIAGIAESGIEMTNAKIMKLDKGIYTLKAISGSINELVMK